VHHRSEQTVSPCHLILINRRALEHTHHAHRPNQCHEPESLDKTKPFVSPRDTTPAHLSLTNGPCVRPSTSPDQSIKPNNNTTCTLVLSMHHPLFEVKPRGVLNCLGPLRNDTCILAITTKLLPADRTRKEGENGVMGSLEGNQLRTAAHHTSVRPQDRENPSWLPLGLDNDDRPTRKRGFEFIALVPACLLIPSIPLQLGGSCLQPDNATYTHPTCLVGPPKECIMIADKIPAKQGSDERLSPDLSIDFLHLYPP
jgi:hypothetical protein